jgi:hypothetical protein
MSRKRRLESFAAASRFRRERTQAQDFMMVSAETLNYTGTVSLMKKRDRRFRFSKAAR